MQIIESSAWRQGSGEDPSRIVLRNLGGHQPFATHIEVRRLSGETFCVSGHYFTDSMAATEDFQKRVARELDRPVVPERASDLIHDGIGLRARGGLVYFGETP